MFSLGIFWSGENEHLDFVELVHANDAAGVFAVGASLPAKAGRPTGIPEGQLINVDDFITVEGSERDF